MFFINMLKMIGGDLRRPGTAAGHRRSHRFYFSGLVGSGRGGGLPMPVGYSCRCAAEEKIITEDNYGTF